VSATFLGTRGSDHRGPVQLLEALLGVRRFKEALACLRRAVAVVAGIVEDASRLLLRERRLTATDTVAKVSIAVGGVGRVGGIGNAGSVIYSTNTTYTV
jgi:hypothetical protein